MLGGTVNGKDFLKELWKLDMETFVWSPFTSPVNPWPEWSFFHVSELAAVRAYCCCASSLTRGL